MERSRSPSLTPPELITPSSALEDTRVRMALTRDLVTRTAVLARLRDAILTVISEFQAHTHAPRSSAQPEPPRFHRATHLHQGPWARTKHDLPLRLIWTADSYEHTRTVHLQHLALHDWAELLVTDIETQARELADSPHECCHGLRLRLWAQAFTLLGLLKSTLKDLGRLDPTRLKPLPSRRSPVAPSPSTSP